MNLMNHNSKSVFVLSSRQRVQVYIHLLRLALLKRNRLLLSDIRPFSFFKSAGTLISTHKSDFAFSAKLCVDRPRCFAGLNIATRVINDFGPPHANAQLACTL